jgi:DNA-binding GntR family transcriptional regulator
LSRPPHHSDEPETQGEIVKALVRELLRDVPPGERLLSERDLALDFGVSQTTMHRVLTEVAAEDGSIQARGTGPNGGWERSGVSAHVTELDRVKALIRDDVTQAGPGAKLPTLEGFAERHGTSRHTARHALMQIEREDGSVESLGEGKGGGWVTAGRGPHLAKDEQIAIALTRDLEQMEPGDGLPGRKELERRFNAGRVAVRAATERLRADGLVEVKPETGGLVKAAGPPGTAGEPTTRRDPDDPGERPDPRGARRPDPDDADGDVLRPDAEGDDPKHQPPAPDVLRAQHETAGALPRPGAAAQEAPEAPSANDPARPPEPGGGAPFNNTL